MFTAFQAGLWNIQPVNPNTLNQLTTQQREDMVVARNADAQSTAQYEGVAATPYSIGVSLPYMRGFMEGRLPSVFNSPLEAGLYNGLAMEHARFND